MPEFHFNEDSVRLAYDFAVTSYDWATRRFEAVDARIHTILGVGMTFTLAVPIGVSALKLSIDNRWFIAAMILFIIALSLGVYARLKGELTLLTPRMLYEKWLGFEETEFRRNLIYFAGQHMEKNRRVVAIKHRWLTLVTVIFFLELACLVVGAVVAPRP